MKKRNVLSSPRLSELKAKRQKVLFAKIFLSVLALTIIFTGLSYLSRIPRLNISSIEVVGNKVIDTEKIEQVAQSNITGKYLWLFPKTNISLYPKSKINKELSVSFKRLKEIDISIKDNKVLEISVSEREAKYLWCETEEKCYFMDESAFIFDEAPYFSGEVYFKFYGQANSDFIKFFTFKKTIEDMGLKPVGLSVMDTGDIKMFLSGKEKPEILLRSDADLQKVAENLQAALGVEPLKSEFKNKYSSLLYIDLRYGNKVYYKFR